MNSLGRVAKYSNLGKIPSGDSPFWREKRLSVCFLLMKYPKINWVTKKAEDEFFKLNRNKINDAILLYNGDIIEIDEKMRETKAEISEICKNIVSVAVSLARNGDMKAVEAYFESGEFDNQYQEYNEKMYERSILVGQKEELDKIVTQLKNLARTTSSAEVHANAARRLNFSASHVQMLMQKYNDKTANESEETEMTNLIIGEGVDQETLEEFAMNIENVSEIEQNRVQAQINKDKGRQTEKTKLTSDKKGFITEISSMMAMALVAERKNGERKQHVLIDDLSGESEEESGGTSANNDNNNNNIRSSGKQGYISRAAAAQQVLSEDF